MRIGIMQGRLSPPQGDQLQFFPKNWKAEFATAKELGFEAIEWIFETLSDNPLMGFSGRKEMLDLSKEERVGVESICADTFLRQHLIKQSRGIQHVLAVLLKVAEVSKVPLVGIPLLEENLPKHPDFEAVVKNIQGAFHFAHNSGVDLALEVDLPADQILELIEEIGSPRVGVCYDTGNAMTHGFDAGADIRKLGRHLKEIHFKDRLKGTRQSVYLGEGSVDFPDVFAALKEVNFQGLGILQAWRGANYLDDAKRQLEFVKNFLK
jgi:L-ribulose-5-phosphate 3-epimerase